MDTQIEFSNFVNYDESLQTSTIPNIDDMISPVAITQRNGDIHEDKMQQPMQKDIMPAFNAEIEKNI